MRQLLCSWYSYKHNVFGKGRHNQSVTIHFVCVCVWGGMDSGRGARALQIVNKHYLLLYNGGKLNFE